MVFCFNCGQEVPDESKFCYKCGMTIKNEEGEINSSYDMDINDEFEVEYASLGIRFVAIFIDGIVINVIVFCLALISIVLINQAELVDVLYYLINIIVFLLYFTVLEGPFYNGQTIGKRLTSIRVVKEDNRQLSYTGSFVRSLLRFVDMIPIIIPYLLGAIVIHSSDKNQRIGDMAAKTVVIRGSKKPKGIKSDESSRKLAEKRNKAH